MLPFEEQNGEGNVRAFLDQSLEGERWQSYTELRLGADSAVLWEVEGRYLRLQSMSNQARNSI